MAYGITRERKLQIGLESSAGTAVAATRVWRGPAGSIVDSQERVLVNENIGYAGRVARSYLPSTICNYAMPETEATFEGLPIILSASIDDIVAGSGVGSTPEAYSYTYAVPTTNGAAATKYYTLEAGNNQQAYEMEYSFVPDWSLKGAQNTALMVSANWQGRQKTATTFTGALTAPMVEEILFNKGKLYYDSASMGDTVQTGSWLGFNLNYVSGWKAVYTGDGNLYWSLPVFKGATITGDITLEDSTLAATIKGHQAAGTTGLMRWLFEGSTTGAGGTYQKKTFRADMAVTWLSVPGNESQDDDDIVTFPFECVISGANYCTFLAVNSLAAIVT